MLQLLATITIVKENGVGRHFRNVKYALPFLFLPFSLIFIRMIVTPAKDNKKSDREQN